jgi:hypothetical protein
MRSNPILALGSEQVEKWLDMWLMIEWLDPGFHLSAVDSYAILKGLHLKKQRNAAWQGLMLDKMIEDLIYATKAQLVRLLRASDAIVELDGLIRLLLRFENFPKAGKKKLGNNQRQFYKLRKKMQKLASRHPLFAREASGSGPRNLNAIEDIVSNLFA